MNIAIWVISGVLAAIYLFAGILKTITPKEKLATNLPWAEDFSPSTIKLIGVAEALGAIGLILPWLTDVAPILTPLAAVGLVVIQALAIPVHLRRGEQKALPINAVLLLLALVVAVGRFAQL